MSMADLLCSVFHRRYRDTRPGNHRASDSPRRGDVPSPGAESFVIAVIPEGGYTPDMTSTGRDLTAETPAIRAAPIRARAARRTTTH